MSDNAGISSSSFRLTHRLMFCLAASVYKGDDEDPTSGFKEENASDGYDAKFFQIRDRIILDDIDAVCFRRAMK